MCSTVFLVVGVSTLLMLVQLSQLSATRSRNNGLTLSRSASRHALNKRSTVTTNCRLPEQPRNGNYQSQCPEGDNSAACRNVPGTAVIQPWVLHYTCDKDYFLSSESEYSICANRGEWQPAVQCIKMCPPLTSINRHVNCVFGDMKVPCDMPMRPNTTATTKCKTDFVQNSQQDLWCQENGEWDIKLQSCSQMCGVPSVPGPVHPQNTETTRGEFPWLTAVYRQNSSQLWDYECAGTLITSHIVLTRAQCVTEGKLKLLPGQVKVGLGKYYRDFYTHDKDSVIVDVREIVINYKDNIWDAFTLLDLVHSVQINAFVMPACVDWDSNYVQPVSINTFGYIAGWFRTSRNLTKWDRIVSTQLRVLSDADCEGKVRGNKKHPFCADFIDGRELFYSTVGEGLTVVKNQKHYVVGVLISYVGSTCVFTNIQNDVNWMLEKKEYFFNLHRNETQLSQPPVTSSSSGNTLSISHGYVTPEQNKPRPVTPTPSAGNCSLPQQPNNGNYVSLCQPGDQSAACRNVPGTAVSTRWVLEYSCDHNYNLSSEYSHSICKNDTWVPSLHCIKLCPPLISLSTDVRCYSSGREVPCDSPMRPTTTATASCKDHYNHDQPPQDLFCEETGEWNHKLQYCTPRCGRSTAPGSLQPVILHGTEAERGEFPWLAAIYYQNKSRLWEQRCGGTLITPYIILTAAHCVILNTGPLLAADLKVGLGKSFRDFYKHEDNSFLVGVRVIATSPHYVGQADKYTLDIALLDLVHSVQINSFVMPACVDWKSNYIQANSFETVGYVAGWGQTEEQNSTPSEKTLATRLTFISNVDCKKTFPRYVSSISHDKFCAGSVNGSQVLRGDSGGGFTVVKNGQHFVVGIVSAKFTNSGTEFSVFTEIKNKEHIAWMDQNRNDFISFHHNET